MPRPRMRFAGIAVLALLTVGCSGVRIPRVETPPPAPTSTPSPSPSPVAVWEEDLNFSGELNGAMKAVVPVDPTTRSECTGRNSKTAGAWASRLFGFVGTDVYGVLFTVGKYRGPGSYSGPQFTVQVHRLDGSAVWQSSGANQATLTVGDDEESGSVDAALTNLSSNQAALQLRGNWSCRT
jgi:hypothetical protein